MASAPLLWIYWNPSRVFFTIPYWNHPVMWYGVLFVSGLALSYWLMPYLFASLLGDDGRADEQARADGRLLTDKLLWYSVPAMLLGARLGHILFYEFDYYLAHPAEIVKTWHGGLASHGGIIAVIIGILFFVRRYRRRYPRLSVLAMLDMLSLPGALCGFFIRVGNFVNQEIVGTPASVPWAVIFGEAGLLPRHPVQLYEAFAYLLIFALLFALWRRRPDKLGSGLFIGLLFTLVFCCRLVCELFKAPQHSIITEEVMTMGQWLSLPFVAVGIYFVAYSLTAKRHPISD